MLKWLGYLDDSTDGIFGSATETAVENFQADCGLTADGIVGKATKAALWDELNGVVPSDCVILN